MKLLSIEMLIAIAAFVVLTGASFGAICFHFYSSESTLRDGVRFLGERAGVAGFLVVAIPYGFAAALTYFCLARFILSRTNKWNAQIEILLAGSIGIMGLATLIFSYPIVCK